MKKETAGLLPYRFVNGQHEILLAHPGGPDNLYSRWSIIKGGVEDGESRIDAAKREFREETGLGPIGPFVDLGSIVLKNGKVLYTWAFPGKTLDINKFNSKTLTVEHPKGSGKFIETPEIDKIKWVTLRESLEMLSPKQFQMVSRLNNAIRP
jgi:predicted NUDIX family NTP pyrophosphohydrolase